nr:MAG TPA: hypothetical protein [Herelleviridae sp.]
MYIGSVKFKTQKGLTTEDSLFVKSRQFTEDFINKYKDIGITDIVIEAPLPNSNNLMTVHTLARFNGMLSQSIFDAISVAPQYISSYDARKYAFPTLMSVRRYDKKDEPYSIDKVRKAIKKNELTPFGGYTYSTDKKYVLWELINKSYDGIVWQYNKKGELKKENFDASDSLVAILGWINYIKYHDDEPKVVDMSEKNISDNDGNTFTQITYSVRFCDETNTKTAVF